MGEEGSGRGAGRSDVRGDALACKRGYEVVSRVHCVQSESAHGLSEGQAEVRGQQGERTVSVDDRGICIDMSPYMNKPEEEEDDR